MRIINLVIVLGLAGAAVAGESPPAPFNYDDPPQGLFSNEWMTVYLGDQRAGFAHETLARTGARIHTRMTLQFDLQRGGQPVTVRIIESTEETIDGRPLAFESTTDMAIRRTVTRGRIVDGKVRIVESQLGAEMTSTFDYPAGALMLWGQYLLAARMGYAPGTSYECLTYAPSIRLDDAVKTSVVVGDREDVQLLRGTRPATKVTQTIHLPLGGELSMPAWVDAQGRPLRAEIPIPGLGNVVLYRSDQEEATKTFVPPELFVKTLVPAGHSIDRARVKRITYRLRIAGNSPDSVPDLPRTGLQRPGPWRDRVAELVVARQDHRRLSDAKPVGSDGYGADLGEYLAPNLMINADDAAVRDMAAAAAGDETRPYALADRLRRYVTGVIKDKNLGIGFATASEVCRQREGDCTEHAVLLAALGRARGIPTRVAIGLVYVPRFGGQQDVFGFHMWTQFHVGGQWVDLDAAQRETDCNPTHIALGVSSLRQGALFDIAMSILQHIGRLEIDIIDAHPADAVSPPVTSG